MPINGGNENSPRSKTRIFFHHSCLLFNETFFNVEATFNETLEEEEAGTSINGLVVNTMYADDAVLLTSNLSDVQYILEKLNNHCNEYGVKLNFNKTNLCGYKAPTESKSDKFDNVEHTH